MPENTVKSILLAHLKLGLSSVKLDCVRKHFAKVVRHLKS